MRLEISNFKYIQKSKGRSFTLHVPTFYINEGEIVFLYGTSGSGKSTFLNLLSGTKESAIRELTLKSYNRIEYIMHECKLLPWHNIYNNIRVINKFNGMIDIAKLKSIIELINLDESVLGLKPWQLSLGMRQRIEIAIAMANKPNLMIFDEALSGIDNKCKQSLCKELYAFIKDNKISLIATAHQISDILRLAERIVFVDNGYVNGIMPISSLSVEERLCLEIEQLYALPEAQILLKRQ